MRRQHFILIIFLFLQSFISYLDRACIAGAVDSIKHDLSFSSHVIGIIFASFALGYGLFQIPAGLLADYLGPRKALAVMVSAWSFFTAATAAVSNAFQMIIVRFLFGASEAGAFPGTSQAVYRWLSPNERGIAYGINFSGTRIGAAFSLFFITWLILTVGWRLAFVINAVFGFLWVFSWLYWFREPVNEETKMNPRHYFGEIISIKELFISVPMILIITQYFASNFTFYIVLSWLPSYIQSQWANIPHAIYYSAIPLLFAALANWVSGSMTSILSHKGFGAWAVRLPAMLGFLLGITGLILATYHTHYSNNQYDLYWFVFCFSIAIFGVDMTLSPSWTFCNYLGNKYSGVVSGTMNMFGQIGGVASAILFPFLINATTGSANAFFLLAAALNVVGMITWFFLKQFK